MHQVFVNIIANAIDAIDKKGEVKISTRLNEKSIDIIFQDNGIGIKADDLNRITDPFFTTKPPGKGTGLGLSICYKIIENHHGNLNFQSEEAMGTRVSISLPL